MVIPSGEPAYYFHVLPHIQANDVLNYFGGWILSSGLERLGDDRVLMVEVFLSKTLSSWADRYCICIHRRWMFCNARLKIAPTVMILDGEAGTQPPHRFERHGRMQDGNEWVMIWTTLYRK
jgi:hypothetical protein